MRISPIQALAVILTACSCGGDRAKIEDFDPGPTPMAYIPGESMYNGSCAQCHGPNASGSEMGPPLVDIVYQPNHHADITFHRAVELGVVPHHWNFGPMPPVEGLTADQVTAIIGYVRWLQRQAGIS